MIIMYITVYLIYYYYYYYYEAPETYTNIHKAVKIRYTAIQTKHNSLLHGLYLKKQI